MPPALIRWVLTRDASGEREPQAFFSTDLTATPEQILGWFVSRWRIKTTFQEVCTHLGVETQRQWSDLAILRTTPALLGLFHLGHYLGRSTDPSPNRCRPPPSRQLVRQARADLQ